MTIDLGRSVTFPFEDKGWSRKLFVLLILGFLPGMNFIAWGGYALSIARNMLRREAQPLAKWDNWADIFVRGLLAIVATGLYYAPLVIFWGCIGLVSLLAGDSGGVIGLRCAGYLLAVIYILVVNMFLLSGHIRFAQTDQFHVYRDIRQRLSDIMANQRLFLALFLYETILSVIAILLAIFGFGAITLGSTLVVNNSPVLACVIVPIVLLVLFGLLAMTTLAFTANGYILGGMSALIIRSQRAPRIAAVS